MTWQDLNNLYKGQDCIFVGRGPTLDDWLSHGCPRSPDSVVIGINSACLVTPCEFSVSADADANLIADASTRWVRGIPYLIEGKEQWTLPAQTSDLWWLHSENTPTGRTRRLDQTRDEIAESRQLYCSTSSAHPAIHFAWYLGFERLMTVGIDGCVGRCKATEYAPGKPPPPEKVYAEMRKTSEFLLNRLFPQCWARWHHAP